jgi:hypothetical protein
MKFAKSTALLCAMTAISLSLAACDTTPPAAANANNQTYERDRPTTGSNIGKRYPTGTAPTAVDQFGNATSYGGGGAGCPTGNCLPPTAK